jgi:hypothetical protein
LIFFLIAISGPVCHAKSSSTTENSCDRAITIQAAAFYKQQGEFGSCWAHSAAALFSILMEKELGFAIDLSVGHNYVPTLHERGFATLSNIRKDPDEFQRIFKKGKKPNEELILKHYMGGTFYHALKSFRKYGIRRQNPLAKESISSRVLDDFPYLMGDYAQQLRIERLRTLLTSGKKEISRETALYQEYEGKLRDLLPTLPPHSTLPQDPYIDQVFERILARGFDHLLWNDNLPKFSEFEDPNVQKHEVTRSSEFDSALISAFEREVPVQLEIAIDEKQFDKKSNTWTYELRPEDDSDTRIQEIRNELLLKRKLPLHATLARQIRYRDTKIQEVTLQDSNFDHPVKMSRGYLEVFTVGAIVPRQ